MEEDPDSSLSSPSWSQTPISPANSTVINLRLNQWKNAKTLILAAFGFTGLYVITSPPTQRFADVIVARRRCTPARFHGPTRRHRCTWSIFAAAAATNRRHEPHGQADVGRVPALARNEPGPGVGGAATLSGTLCALLRPHCQHPDGRPPDRL